jgi:hypothetical protein
MSFGDEHEHKAHVEVRYGPGMVLIRVEEPFPPHGLIALETEKAWAFAISILNACWASSHAEKHPGHFAEVFRASAHRAVERELTRAENDDDDEEL